MEPFKYIVCTTKNIPDIPPTLDENIRPAVTPDYTVIVLIQNGLNIEKPIISAFPTNVILSGVSFCGSHEVGYGNIVHEDNDELTVGAFHNSKLNSKLEEEEARKFCEIYGSGGKCIVEYNFDVAWTRWRKLLYNACLNSICAMTDLDTGRIQLADGAVDNLVRPAMEEIRAAAKASGYDIPPELVDFIIKIDLITMYDPPSMQVDIRKVTSCSRIWISAYLITFQGRYCEFENIVGEPLREGLAKGIPMPTLTVFYNILMAIQWRLKEKNGLIEIPEPEDHTVPNQPLGVKFNSR